MARAGRKTRRKSGSDGRSQEALGVLLLLVGTFLLLSLLSFNPTEYDSSGSVPANWMGLIGARVAEVMVYEFGRLPPLLTIVVVYLWGWRLLRHTTDRALGLLTLKILGIQLFLSILLAFPHFLGTAYTYDMAGRIGGTITGALVTYTGVVGAPLIWVVGLLLFLMGAFGVKPGSIAGAVAAAAAGVAALFVGIGALLKRLSAGLGARFGGAVENLRARRQRKADQQAVKASRDGKDRTNAGTVGGEMPPDPEPSASAAAPVGEDPDLFGGVDDGATEAPSWQPVRTTELPPAPAPPRGESTYAAPPLDIFANPAPDEMGPDPGFMEQQARLLEEKLVSFGVQAEVSGWQTGPVITRFEVRPAPGVKVNQIVNLADDLALAMRAKRIRIVAPIPGKAAVGVEIPNPNARVVRMREVLESDVFARPDSRLPLALGSTINGEPFAADLGSMPHVLIAGATGSGKSVCINALIASLLYRMGPEECRFIMIDPKMLELGIYNTIPHLITPVVIDPKKAVDALKWAVLEMEERFNMLARLMVRDLDSYNAKVRRLRAEAEEKGIPEDEQEVPDPLPYLVVVVDELADLMMTASADIETLIQRIAQKARAVGIHLILATQRPSVDVITGPIKANLSCRIGFQVPSKIDSRTILDANGAEKLLGRGDMLYRTPNLPEPIRIHGAFISGEEIERLVNFVSGQELDTEEMDIFSPALGEGSGMGAAGEDLDDMLRDAATVVVINDQGSISLIQRRLAVGYTRAARMMDQLEMLGVVGPPDGTKAREVLLTEEDLENLPWGGRR